MQPPIAQELVETLKQAAGCRMVSIPRTRS
jgi:hypothetical protein